MKTLDSSRGMRMDSKLLMIGDWVLWKNKPVQIVRVSGIRYEFGHYDVLLAHCNNMGDGIENHDISSISPIPLTAEILEKNGLKYEVDYGGYHRSILGSHSKDNEPLICVQWNPQGEISQWEVSNKSGILTGVVAYGYTEIAVHELQHILRMVGLNELADNFII